MNAATAATNQGNNNAAPGQRKNHFKANNGFKSAGTSVAVNNSAATSANGTPQQPMKSASKSNASMAPFRLPKSKKKHHRK